MKTNVIMTRKMGEFEVKQRTKDSMFSATDLSSLWNKKTGQRKEIANFFANNGTKAFIAALQEDTETQEILYLKSRGKGGGTWMHPYLFIKFAMWLNPSFEVQVIKFIADELIENRHSAGDNYRPFIGCCLSLGVEAKEAAKILNLVVYNIHENGIRNKSTQSQLEDLHQLEQKYTMLITEGYITNKSDLKKKLRHEWGTRHSRTPKELL